MIINKKTIQAPRNRVQWHKPVISVVSTGISFTKDAAQMIGAPCKIYFEKLEFNGGGLMLWKSNDEESEKESFEVKQIIQYEHNHTWQVHCRPLAKFIMNMYLAKDLRFELSQVANENGFLLKPMKQ